MYGWIIFSIWAAWSLYWLILARNTKATARRESIASRASHLIPLVIGCLLIAQPNWFGDWLSGPMLPRSLVTYWVGVAMLAAGLGFSAWARLHIGANWSGTVTLKDSHQLVRSGPYAWVRHPIYTGLLLALLGSAVARNEWRSLIGFALVLASLMRKLRIEERWMREMFAEQYASYAREVPALVPWFR
jgi:protein-S-isoprenylcysteine O-methyltransferase Ste14